MTLLWCVVAATFILFGAVVFFGAPYVPSHRREVKRVFTELYELSKDDVLIDLGAGDGRILQEAGRYGARAIGYELNPLLVMVARWVNRRNSKVEVRLRDFWRSQWPVQTTVVYIFGVSRDSAKLARKMQLEANRHRQVLHLITYGPALHGHHAVRQYRGHHLYTFKPLQGRQAQV